MSASGLASSRTRSASLHVQCDVRYRVDMHVPQAGNEKAAGSVEHVRIVGHADLGGRADSCDAIANDEHCLIGAKRSICHIHDRDLSESHGRRNYVRAGGEQQAGNSKEDFHDRSFRHRSSASIRFWPKRDQHR